MSEDFLTRWSRRKRDALEDEQTKAAPGDHDALPEDAVPENTTSVEGSERATSPEPVFDLKSLPPIESITAATDIRPFLAPAVPLEIARAALRRAWSADPRIRNFVGLADYDWDYHTPGSAAGFGPLEMTDELRPVAMEAGTVRIGNRGANDGYVTPDYYLYVQFLTYGLIRHARDSRTEAGTTPSAR